ncbi:UDP-N-acetylglucosamine 2-epimerase [Mucisphaera calidilacus]|uniref:UDP-N,N'-diacetylbacillosamine 2-epimerase (Hydrolyzing) n=1 Tax=Mucisphaera calidilacus TaxID=2527982 RepID=A0A518C141_9BACT|nr:UDP-N-acetylglucosamine 2-epimerase [Mucisphaera calidilacus]QDU72914.1 UDP-N,N'-diacetylbacillosamine 2-epimerase (hydrolyzing) [Mucisphaera calidilacus]
MAGQEPRRVAIVTGTRAEFGLLRPVIDACLGRSELETLLLVTGTHLTRGTVTDVRSAGYRIHREVMMQLPGDRDRLSESEAVGRGVMSFATAWREMVPDVVLVLGDRVEAFAAAASASVGGVRVAHVHGGDRAEGVADEAMRHAISKLAHLHFAASAESRRRLVRMGEASSSVFRVGSPAMDGLDAVKPAEDAPRVIVMQHPIGAADDQERAWMRGTLRAVAKHDPLVMWPNSDAGSAGIRSAIEEAGLRTVDHLPRERFLSLLAGCEVLVGNSSAGLIEAAGLRRAAVNVGPRQGGRERPASVLDCDYGERAVRAAVRSARGLDLRRMRHPYGRGDAGVKIAEVLAELDLAAVPVRKRNAY